ncbi:MAG: riboflavin kinase, partial [Gammaproteobacteria bacterium]|nr:riboflavin kinase [Gammaproteobacteria bacterium]
VNETKALLEVFLFDFDQDIYGEHIQVSFLKKLRDEEKFASIEKLKQQIQMDVEQAQAYFAA